MRTHRKHSALICWTDTQLLREAVSVQHLVAARLEPITRGLRGGAGLDLTFVRNGRVAVVPLIEIVPEMLTERESSAFVWPQAVAGVISDDAARGLEKTILPWIESRTLGQALSTELTRVYGDAQQRSLFERARSFGFLGAAPYRTVLQSAAPYAYAARFAENARVRARDAAGATGAAMLTRHAGSVRVDLCDAERNACALAWFGLDIFGGVDAACDVAIAHEQDALDAPVRIVLGDDTRGTVVNVATPVPTDVMISFDTQDAPPAATFSVTCATRRSLRESQTPAVRGEGGGSAGRILVLVRNDWQRAADADTDDAESLAQLLRAEGFSVDVSSPAQNADSAAYDLVHAFGLTRANEFCESLRAARRAGVPTIFTAALDDISAGGAWGSGIVRSLARIAYDETALQDYLAMLAGRRLEAPGLNAQRQELFAGYETSVRDALALSDAVLASGPSEESLLRSFGFSGLVLHVPPYLGCRDAAPADELIGSADFTLVHAPIEARCNQLPLVRAAVSSGTTLVLAGQIVEPDYYQTLRDFANERVVFVPEPSEGVVESLYRTARVFADPAWYRFGLARVVRAWSAGCAVVLASTAHVGDAPSEGVWKADPADADSIAGALTAAWASAARRPRPFDPRTAVMATAGAYDRAQRSRTPA